MRNFLSINMLKVTLAANLKSLVPQSTKLNSFAVTTRYFSAKTVEAKDLRNFDDPEDPEEVKAREAAIEKKRNKSNLFPADYNIQHDKPRYEESLWEHQESLQYRRRLYGKFGKLSNVDPSILWPSKKELDAMKEFEAVSQPFTIHQLIKKVQEAKKAEVEERRIAEDRILKKVANIDSEIQEFYKKNAEKKKKLEEIKEKKEKLIEKIRSHFGYKISVKDERFKTMLAELEKEEKLKIKAAKKEKKAKMAELAMKKDSSKENKEENEE